MIDNSGYRLNVGIILVNNNNKLFLGRRVGRLEIWQFPQGGLQDYETVEEAMFRELKEEVGLVAEDVKILGWTRRWLYYQLPRATRRSKEQKLCVGQKQKWYLLELIKDDSVIRFDHTDHPEFETWNWVDYWYPLEKVVDFKRQVYEQALTEFQQVLFGKEQRA